MLIPSTPNDGAQGVAVINTLIDHGANKDRSVGNIFFDISDTDFTISGPTAAPASISGTRHHTGRRAVGGVTMNLSGAEPPGQSLTATATTASPTSTRTTSTP